MQKEIQYAIEREATWRKLLGTTDRGSYCESAGHDCKMTQPVVNAYENLVNALLAYQRTGLKEPGASQP